MLRRERSTSELSLLIARSEGATRNSVTFLPEGPGIRSVARHTGVLTFYTFGHKHQPRPEQVQHQAVANANTIRS